MKIYNEAKTRELTNPDLTKGKLLPDKILVTHHAAIEAAEQKSHLELLESFDGGGNTFREIVDQPATEAREAWDEYEDINVYVLFTAKETAQRQIAELKTKLRETDYKAIKYAEGEMTAAEYKATKAERAAWRAEINELEDIANG